MYVVRMLLKSQYLTSYDGISAIFIAEATLAIKKIMFCTHLHLSQVNTVTRGGSNVADNTVIVHYDVTKTTTKKLNDIES